MEATWKYIIQRNMSIYFLINSKYAIMFRELLDFVVDDRCDRDITCHNSNIYILFFPGMICRIPSPCLLLLLHLYPTSMWGRCGTTVASMKLGRTPPLPTVPSLSDRLSQLFFPLFFFFFFFIFIPLLCGVDVGRQSPPCSSVVHLLSRQSLLSQIVFHTVRPPLLRSASPSASLHFFTVFNACFLPLQSQRDLRDGNRAGVVQPRSDRPAGRCATGSTLKIHGGKEAK